MQRVQPLYLAVDTTASMAGRLRGIEEAVIRLTDELLSSPVLGERIRVAIVTFADDAELVLPLSDLTDLRTLPRLSAGGATFYGPLFRQLAKIIDRDTRLLQARNTEVFRPIVFLITDGSPIDAPSWEREFRKFDDVTRAQLVAIVLDMDGLPAGMRDVLHPVAEHVWNDGQDGQLPVRLASVLTDVANSLTRSVLLTPRDGEGPFVTRPFVTETFTTGPSVAWPGTVDEVD